MTKPHWQYMTVLHSFSKQKYGWARFHRRMQPPNPLEAVEPENSLETAATNAFRDPPYWIYSHSRGVIQAVTCIYAAASWDIWVLSLFVVTCIAINLQNQKKKKNQLKCDLKKMHQCITLPAHAKHAYGLNQKTGQTIAYLLLCVNGEINYPLARVRSQERQLEWVRHW